MTSCPGPPGAGAVIVEIEDVTAPARFQHLPDALAALWRSLRELPLGADQSDAFEYFLTRREAAARVHEFLVRDGSLTLTLRMDGRLHSVLIRPAGGDQARPRPTTHPML
ncbi:hypothetical protein OG689_15705 [Kitasatospora sp. NBC_00240]|uniref:hypothetical protein n=1 Tax=Kitasatospora sp. NBC_00240 TaxID=2903567 RepID=UPI00225C3D61|nr:hypothetical protein [Kitasatospora sp. NBC_00240]MCX5210715.1 hypothetical protein [Kitasatospora sp. NBC_00240]